MKTENAFDVRDTAKYKEVDEETGKTRYYDFVLATNPLVQGTNKNVVIIESGVCEAEIWYDDDAYAYVLV